MNLWQGFWGWYERTYTVNVSIALGLFLIQLVHLAWLTGEVVWTHLFGAPLFVFAGIWEKVIILVDYTEIPALISVSLVYIDQFRHERDFKSVLYLVFLNSQWLHILWITDEYVVTMFNNPGTILPLWLAYVAIAIDYLELPVMLDTFKKFFAAVGQRQVRKFLKEDFREGK